MMRDGTHAVLLVHNRNSTAGVEAAQRAAAIFRAAGIETRHLHAETPQLLSQSLAQTLKDHARDIAAVVAVGGDGMSHLVVQELHRCRSMGLDFLYGLIPAGSGNDLARSQNIPTHDVERAAGLVLRCMERDTERRMDLLRVQCADGAQHLCTTVVCLGLDARVNQRANAWHRIRSSVKYAAALGFEALRLPGRTYEFTFTTASGTTVTETRSCTFVTVNNTPSLGGGMRAVPHAQPWDGLGEFLTVDTMSPWRFVTLVPHLLNATHLGLRQVHLTTVRELTATVVGTALQRAYGDGEQLGPLPATVSIVPAALRVAF